MRRRTQRSRARARARALLGELLALVAEDEPVTDTVHLAEVMAREQDGTACVRVGAELVEYPRAQRGVEALGDLVEEADPNLEDAYIHYMQKIGQDMSLEMAAGG